MNWIKTAALLSLVLVLGVRAQADSLPKSYRNSQSAILTGVFGLHTISPSKAPKTSSPASLRASATKPNFGFTAFIPGQGRVRFRFRKNRKLDVVPVFEENGITRPDPKGVTLLQGDYLLKAAKGAAAASIYTPISTPRLFAAFAARSLRSGRLRYFRVELPLTDKLKTSATAQVRRLPSHAMLRKTCGGKLLAQLSPDELSMDKESHTPTLARAVSSNTIQIVQLGIEADSAWYQIYKSNSNAALSTFLNEAETLYERQLSLTYQITRQVVYTNRSFGTSQAEEKLKAYQKYTLGKSYFGASDAFHLFTGETLQNNVIGLSFLGVICRSKTSSFGLTQSTNSLMIPITFAHELAHNFNATHDESYPPTIMFPAITNPPSQVFSEFSRKEIRDFVARYGSRCLTPKGGTPTPSPTPNP
ncbi:MAG: hypothetical protein GX589_06410, partial [Deltaproteobacteria bacterium]|nr:hypothetical protein [Deltaproteobacteria bacterium]